MKKKEKRRFPHTCPYEICPGDEKYAAVIYATTGLNPLVVIDRISKDLKRQKCNRAVRILFDLFACGGRDRTRFMEGWYDGRIIDLAAIRTANVSPDCVRSCNMHQLEAGRIKYGIWG